MLFRCYSIQLPINNEWPISTSDIGWILHIKDINGNVSCEHVTITFKITVTIGLNNKIFPSIPLTLSNSLYTPIFIAKNCNKRKWKYKFLMYFANYLWDIRNRVKKALFLKKYTHYSKGIQCRQIIFFYYFSFLLECSVSTWIV